MSGIRFVKVWLDVIAKAELYDQMVSLGLDPKGLIEEARSHQDPFGLCDHEDTFMKFMERLKRSVVDEHPLHENNTENPV